ncbi:MAG TPA: SURF1 family protein [Candidatus Ruania gallistercoris]|uniref:SURF1-like protein n=1 Tax=Candidatus Ruania gallistercoris TaxID=2838746 RepID=A0A9D2EBK9_9MICO|nr:SURF1 family protein [Candidatus Ruania gallistercoris]
MRHRYAFLRSTRWLGITALVLAVSITCVLLGRWQLSRYETKADQADLVTSNYDAAPVPATELLPTPESPLAHQDTWRSVQLTGEYLTPSLLLPQRPIEGSAADHVIGVFAADTTEGTWLLVVDRGWYPTDSFTDHSAQAALPEGEVQLTVRMRAAEGPSARDLGPGRLHALNPQQVLAEQAAVGDDVPDPARAELVSGAYGILAEEQPSTTAAPTPLPRPSTDLGNHLSYAFQWWVFGAGVWVGLVVLARREADGLGAAAPSAAEAAPAAESGRPEPATRSRRRMRFADDAAEDALIDAQLAEQQPESAPVGVEDGPAQARDTSSR